MRTGMCDYGVNCRFNHPSNLGLVSMEVNYQKVLDNQTVGYVERLLDRISNGTLAEDRRNAIAKLQSVVAESCAAQLAFGAMGFSVLLSVLKEERDDVEMQILDSFCATMYDESLLLRTVENSHLTTCQNTKGAAKPILLFIKKFVPDFHKSKDLLDRILKPYDRVITTEGLWVHPHGVTKEMEQLVHQKFLLLREFEDRLCDFRKQYVDGGSVKDVLLDHFEDILGKKRTRPTTRNAAVHS